MRKSLRLTGILLLGIASFASAQPGSQAAAPPPPIDVDGIVVRAKAFYETNDFAAAFMRFRDAAQANNVEAMMYLGLMYANGEGTPVDYGQAMTWFRKASDKGDIQAMCNMGILYYRGLGTAKRY